MGSKGWGFSSADVGVFSNHQRIEDKFMRFLRFGSKGSICSRGWGCRKAGAAPHPRLKPWTMVNVVKIGFAKCWNELTTSP